MRWDQLTKLLRRTQPELITDALRVEEQKHIHQWWNARRGPLTSDDLNNKQRTSLAAWYLLARAEIPRPYEEQLPWEAEQPLVDLDKLVTSVTGDDPGRAQFGRYELTVSIPHGKRRKCKARKKRSGLAT